MVAHVRVDGVWIGTMFPTTEVEHSTGWLVDEPSGDLEASVEVACDPNYQANWTLPGRRFDVWAPNGGRLWGGTTVEPDRSAGGIKLHGLGFGSTLEKYRAVEFDIENGWLPTFIPNDAVDAAEARGAPFSRYGVNLGTTSLAETDDGPIVTVGTLLSRGAIAQGKRVHVDSQGAITFQADPTTAKWTLTPAESYMGTADEQFVTTLWGYYLKTPDPPDPDSGITSTPAVVLASDPDAADKFGTRERSIDLSKLGLLLEDSAQDYIDGRFALVGGRMGWTEGVGLSMRNIMHISGAWADPRFVKAGDMLQIPGVVDARSNPTTRGAIQFVLSEVEVTEAGDPSAFATPVGFTPRDFEGTLAPPEDPTDKEAA